jgi:hypothetical protein
MGQIIESRRDDTSIRTNVSPLRGSASQMIDHQALTYLATEMPSLRDFERCCLKWTLGRLNASTINP